MDDISEVNSVCRFYITTLLLMSGLLPLAETEVRNPDFKPRIRLEILSNQIKANSNMASGSSVKSPITTHVLNTATGRPAADLMIKLYRVSGKGDSEQLSLINSGHTNPDGRLPGLLTKEQFTPGTYKVRFETEEYFNKTNTEGFYPYAEVVFVIRDVDQHYHIPLLLSPYGYSTYRGS